MVWWYLGCYIPLDVYYPLHSCVRYSQPNYRCQMLLGRMELSDCMTSAKYTLRTKSILKRIESERTRHTTTTKRRETKEKEKPPPLSKYRRKTANARERNRMKEINDAFISLQSSLPDIPGADTDKLTKITVLKLAVNYISALARVLDNSTTSMDVEDVRQMWCHDNAHITKTENCVKTIVKTSGGVKKMESTGKSRSRGKICRTNSVATNNGAYITLKNCAMQTTHNSSKTRVINNQPLMMSMTVKRTRMEPVVGHRSIKMRKYEPQLSYGTTELAQFNQIPSRSNRANSHQSSPNKKSSCPTILNNSSSNFNDRKSTTITPHYQFLPLHTLSPEKSMNYDRLSNPYNKPLQQHKINYSTPTPVNFSPNPNTINLIPKSNYYHPTNDNMQYLSIQTKPESYPMGGLTFSDLNSPPVRNDVLLEFPREVKQSSPSDSAFSSGESAPSSPTLSLHSHSPPLEDLSPFNSLTSSLSGGSSTSACSISSTDCDSVFNSLLDCQPFQEELDHFTSAFNEGANNPFNLFIDQQSSAFVNYDIDGYWDYSRYKMPICGNFSDEFYIAILMKREN